MTYGIYDALSVQEQVVADLRMRNWPEALARAEGKLEGLQVALQLVKLTPPKGKGLRALLGPHEGPPPWRPGG